MKILSRIVTFFRDGMWIILMKQALIDIGMRHWRAPFDLEIFSFHPPVAPEARVFLARHKPHRPGN
jgi:hypothetical protein